MGNAEFCANLNKEIYVSFWTNMEIVNDNKTINHFIKQKSLKKCKKSEATALLIVGEKSENGYFISGKYKNYWLRNKV